MLSFFFQCVPARVESRSLGLQIPVDANDFFAGLGIGCYELTSAAGNFLVKLGHGYALLSLAVGRFAGDLGGAIVTATRHADQCDP